MSPSSVKNSHLWESEGAVNLNNTSRVAISYLKMTGELISNFSLSLLLLGMVAETMSAVATGLLQEK